ncbi:MAG: alpha/beta fold hydrolase, partial [Pyrinomonadaceae bacterium]|nr:alpha/beta fold hydrolase [Pyrinomonadaceae bacterium]
MKAKRIILVTLMLVLLIASHMTTERATSARDAESGNRFLQVNGVQQQTSGGQPQNNGTNSLVAAWQGELDAGIKLRLVLKVAQAADGSLTSTLDSLDQAATNLPVDTITLDGARVRFEMKRLGAVYEGTLSADKNEIVGEWKQGATPLPLTFKRTAKPLVLNRPQEPKKPYPYAEEEVAYENKTDGVRLAGTLTLPRSQKPVPAVVLITGSGAQDRNETVFGHKPFLVLADYLTRRGIAVLRIDDRGFGRSTGNFITATSENFVLDAAAGVEFLKTRKEINPKQIGLVGHSEGGMIAPMLAAKSSDVAFIVLMAGPGLTGEEILYRQAVLILKASGATDEAVAKNRIGQERYFAVIKGERDNTVAARRIREISTELEAGMTEEQKKALRSSDAQTQFMLSPWFRYFLTYDPRPNLRRVQIPVLAINGELDLQVPPKENLSAITEALKAGGNKDFTT